MIGSEHRRRILLASQSSPQGAGVVFPNQRGADFLVAVAPAEAQASGRDKRQAHAAWLNAPGKFKAALACASKENRVCWRYASLVTPGALRSIETSSYRERGSSGDRTVRISHGALGRYSHEKRKKGPRYESDDPATATTGSAPFHEEDNVVETEEDCDEFRRRLAGLEGGGGGTGGRGKTGPGPGGALWMPASKATVGRGAPGSPSRRPKKAKVRRLVRHLEAGLKLKGRPGAGGLPAVGSQRVDLPYTKELAKWSYDEILGIPRIAKLPG